MSRIDAGGPSARVDLALAIRPRSWEWFLCATAGMNVAAEIVDDRGTSLLPLATGATAATLRHLLTVPGASALRTAVVAAIRWNQAQHLSVDHVHIGCYPLAAGSAIVGALVLARFAAPGDARMRSQTGAPAVWAGSAEASEEPARELSATASWLVRAVEAHLSSEPGSDEHRFDRISALHRLLHDAVQSGAERHVVAAFAEAVAVWDDIEVRGYVEDVRGRLVLDVALPGSQGGAFETLEHAAVPAGDALARVSFADAERLGFSSDRDVLVARFGGPVSQPWVVLLSGSIGPRDEPRLALYVELLRETLANAANVGATRTSWAIVQHLLGAGDGIEATAEKALKELSRAVAAVDAALIVPATAETPALAVGNDGWIEHGAPDSLHQIVTTASLLDRQTMTLAVGRPMGQPFTRRDQQVVERVAAIVAVWLSGALRRGRPATERRASARQFADVLERTAVRTVQDGLNITVVVIAISDQASPDLIHQWVATIRGQLRASDLAGTLSEREIAVLLAGASSEEAAGVIARIRQRLEPREQGDRTPATTIGLASRTAGAIIDESLIRAARDDAARPSLA